MAVNASCRSVLDAMGRLSSSEAAAIAERGLNFVRDVLRMEYVYAYMSALVRKVTAAPPLSSCIRADAKQPK